ncbi:hypothetical protein ACP275_11G101600 [Erythranthe tilingii]
MKSSISIVVFMMLLLFISDIGSTNGSEEDNEKVAMVQSKKYRGTCLHVKCRGACGAEGYKDGACLVTAATKAAVCMCANLPWAGGGKVLQTS